MPPHARTELVNGLFEPSQSAAALGYRLPAEFEPQAAVWVSIPHNADTWPGCLEQARRQFEQFLAGLGDHVAVHTTQQHGIVTDDSWIRDYGPLFVVRRPAPESRSAQPIDAPPQHDLSPLACHDFVFNCWGGKYGPFDQDDVVPQHIAARRGIPIWLHEMVLEGGAIDVNGRGCLLTTEQCLLNVNRNPGMSQGRIERRLEEAFNVSRIIWLAGGITGDDTDGHVDDVARFTAPDTIAAVRVGRGHRDFDVLEENWRRLKAARDVAGGPFTLIELPGPQPVYYDLPPGAEYDVGRAGLPASYANFLISNGAVFVPIFGQKADELALGRLEQAMPGYRVIGVRSEYLIVGMGALHCLTMQEPAVTRA